MREYIKEQLKKCVYADLSNYDEEQNLFFIPKYTKPTFDLGKCYLIKLPIDMVNNTNTALSINWNFCTAPKYQYYKIYVSKIAGRMIQVDGIAYDFETKRDLEHMWSGWLEIDSVTQIAIL